MIHPHGLRTPPRHLVEALRRLNPRLSIAWRDDVERWILYERTKSGRTEPVRVLEDVERGREFVEFSQRALEDVAVGDSWRRPRGVDSIVDEIQRKNQRREEALDEQMFEACLDGAKYVQRKARGVLTFDFGSGRWTPRRNT